MAGSFDYQDALFGQEQPWGTMIWTSLASICNDITSQSAGALRQPDPAEPWYRELELSLNTVMWRHEVERWPLHRVIAELVGLTANVFHQNLHQGCEGPITAGLCCGSEVEPVSQLARNLAIDIEEDGYLHVLPGSLGGSQVLGLQEIFEATRTMDELTTRLSSFFASSLSAITNTKDHRRRPLPLTVDQPIIQVNNSRSDEDMGVAAFRANRMLAEEIARLAEGQGYRSEATGRYAPYPPDVLPKDEEATLAGLLRASAVVTLTANARVGTGLAIGLLASVQCPIFVAISEGCDPARRFGGQTYGYVEYYYQSKESLLEQCDLFLNEYRQEIHRRNNKLLGWSAQSVDEIQRSIDITPEELFTSATLHKRRAVFWASDPVYWHQCPPLVQQEILQTVGMTIIDNPTVGTSDYRSAQSLLTYGLMSGTQYVELLALWVEAHRRLRMRHVGSHKDFAWSVDQWEDLAREMRNNN